MIKWSKKTLRPNWPGQCSRMFVYVYVGANWLHSLYARVAVYCVCEYVSILFWVFH